MNAISVNPPRQAGAALLVFTALLILISASMLLDRLSSRAQLNTDRELETTAALAEAKAALIAWSVTHPQTPGRLPYPDRNKDPAGYDGISDCITSPGILSPSHLLGRLPRDGEYSPGSGCFGLADARLGIEAKDAGGEPLWYAVSANLVVNSGTTINPGLLDCDPCDYDWLTVVDQNGDVISDRVAAVIIAPGAALEGQDRSAAAPDPEQFLDSVAGVESNSDYDCSCPSDLVFIQYPDSRFTPVETDSFNDRLVFITIDELMRRVERRVLGDAAVSLQAYRATHGRYPWLSPYRDPTVPAAPLASVTGRLESVGGGGIKITDDDADFCNDGVDEGHIIVNVTRRTFTTVKECKSATKLDLDANIDFAEGHAYNVLPAFNGIWGQRKGHIPFIDTTAGETHALATGFTLTWNNGTAAPAPNCTPPPPFPAWLSITGDGCTQLQKSYQSGSFTQPQPAVPATASANGECIWTDKDNVDCFCHFADCDQTTEVRSSAYTVEIDCGAPCGGIILDAPVRRTYVYTFDYTGTGTVTSANNVKTRQVTNTAPETIFMQDAITVLGNDYIIWSGTVTVPAGSYVMDEMYFDIEDGNEFPDYFFTNLWHHYIYTKIAADHVAINEGTSNPSTDDCTTSGVCVTLQIGSTTRSDVQAVLVGAGGQLTGQTRSDGNLSDYFENNNAVTANDSADRGVLSATFNDQVRVIQPNPP